MPSMPRWTLSRGANVVPGGVHFAVWAPRARTLSVRLEGGAARGVHVLSPLDGEPGAFAATVTGAAAGDDYALLIDDDATPLPDPVSRWLPRGVHGPTRVVDPSAFAWTDAGWRGVGMRDLAIYELHVGTFTPEGTLDSAIGRLDTLADLGITAVELMPVAQFPGTRNWGYDGVAWYAVQDSYGGPDALRRFVDAAHARGIAVLLDVVYNHLGPEGNYLDRFGPYHTERYRTPWGKALNYDDADSGEVRRYVIDNALHWITEYHIDGLRLDAVHGIFDFGASHLLAELTEAAHREANRLGRRVVVIAESDLNDPRIVRAAAEHGYGLDGQWSDDFHHAVHAALTGEGAGYYADFGGAAAVAKALDEPFVYAGTYSRHRRRAHGASSAGLPRERFVVAVQNHDQVGNRALGDRLSTLVTPAQLRLAAMLLLTSPYVPLLFMGEEYGETNPFQYFVSHSDEQLVEAVRKGRRAEFEAFGWGDDVPDPQAESTFVASRLDWSKPDRPPHSGIRALYRDLLALRRDSAWLRAGGSEHLVSSGAEGWVTVFRPQPGVLAAYNLSAEPATVPLPLGTRADWEVLVDSESTAYGGGGSAERHDDASASKAIILEPWTALLLRRTTE